MLRSTLVASLLVFGFQAGLSADDAPAKTTEVKLRDLTLNIPESWKKSPQRSRMRLATFAIPAAEGDDGDGELAIYSFPGGGGGVEANITRWIGQFAREGRENRTTVGQVGENTYYVVDVTGTYNQPVGPPIRQQTKPVAGSRMLAVILQLDKGVYYLKMTGKEATVSAQSDAFRAAFGGSAKSEKEHGEGGGE